MPENQVFGQSVGEGCYFIKTVGKGDGEISANMALSGRRIRLKRWRRHT